jgi:general secretion pathway protein A
VNKKLLSLYGLKWNPFTPDVPAEALLVTPKIESFAWRIEQLVREGGFAAIHGDPGTGKSVVLRILATRLEAIADVTVGVLSRPQAHANDFYRELGELFGVALSPHNRWAGAKALRQRWKTHIEASLCRPVLLVDEAQEMLPSVLGELRLLCSTDLDSRQVLTVVLAGDQRLADKLRTPELMALGSRLRTRLRLEPACPEELQAHLRHVLAQAGSPKLIADAVVTTLSEHAAGNLRVLMNLGHELLAAAVEREAATIDEKLFFEVYGQTIERRGRKVGAR